MINHGGKRLLFVLEKLVEVNSFRWGVRKNVVAWDSLGNGIFDRNLLGADLRLSIVSKLAAK